MNAVLGCNSLTKMYKHRCAIENLDLELAPGRIVGLLGPNGSGKTTLMKLACGLLVPSYGGILINGMAPGVETKKCVSYLPEHTYFPLGMRVREALEIFEDFYSDFSREKAISMLEDLKIDQRDKFSSMSKGTREKVQLILVMSREADLYLLDEPIGGVDPVARDYILDTIIRNYSETATMVISTHLIGDIEKVLDDVVMIKEGKLVMHDSVDALREKYGKSIDGIFKEVFKC